VKDEEEERKKERKKERGGSKEKGQRHIGGPVMPNGLA
jgi:hypothetical protein